MGDPPRRRPGCLSATSDLKPDRARFLERHFLSFLLYIRRSYKKRPRPRGLFVRIRPLGSPGKQSCSDVCIHLEQGQQERQDYLSKFGKIEIDHRSLLLNTPSFFSSIRVQRVANVSKRRVGQRIFTFCRMREA